MSKQTINNGTVANDDTGDTLHDAVDKINQNFTELYDGLGSVPPFSVPTLPSSSSVTLVWDPTISKFIARQLTQNDLTGGFATTFTGSPPALVLLGSAIVNPTFNMSYSRTPTSATLSDNAGNPSQNVLGATNPVTRPYTYTKTVHGQSVTWSLNSADALGSDTDAITTTWTNNIYYGVGTAGQTTEAFIKSLTAFLATSKNATVSVNANVGQKIYFACRAAYGDPTFTFGGFTVTMIKRANINVTNNGVTEAFNLYESNSDGLGPTTFTTS